MAYRKIYKIISIILVLTMFNLPVFASGADNVDDLSIAVINEEETDNSDSSLPVVVNAPSAILIEQTTGKVILEKNADQKIAPASITKVMSMLLIMEALESGKISLDDKVSCSEHAMSMGGSQIWLEPGEEFTVHELLKAVAIGSANDATVALAEHIAGSEEAFVDMMNKRAGELSMTSTTFHNASGLDAEGHITSARDVAIMSMELLKHKKISEYSTIWMDSLRDGKTALVNTNRLIRFYKGATGLKTGTTDDAGHCLSASATRNGLSLVAVVMGAKTTDDRFNSARNLLDFGFSNYTLITPEPVNSQLAPVKVILGTKDEVQVRCDTPESIIAPKGAERDLTQTVEIAEDVKAPVYEGQTLGKVTVKIGDEVCGEYLIKSCEEIPKLTFFKAFYLLISSFSS